MKSEQPEKREKVPEFLPTGDQSDLAGLYDELYPTLVRLAWAIIREPGLAHDAAQESFALLAQKLREQPESIPQSQQSGWLIKTVQFTAQNIRRKQSRNASRSSPIPLDEIDSGNDSQIERAFLLRENKQRLQQAIRQLPPEQRQVLELRFTAGLSFAEIAAKEDKPLGTILSRMRIALKKLKQEFADE